MKNKLKSNTPQIHVICEYVLNECEHDSHLAERVMLENKTVANMYEYILTAVRNKFKDQIKSNGVMVAKEDVYNLAIHYFIEDDETLNAEFKEKVTKAEVKANSKPAKTTPKKAVEPKTKESDQLSLFDFGVEV